MQHRTDPILRIFGSHAKLPSWEEWEVIRTRRQENPCVAQVASRASQRRRIFVELVQAVQSQQPRWPLLKRHGLARKQNVARRDARFPSSSSMSKLLEHEVLGLAGWQVGMAAPSPSASWHGVSLSTCILMLPGTKDFQPSYHLMLECFVPTRIDSFT